MKNKPNEKQVLRTVERDEHLILSRRDSAGGGIGTRSGRENEAIRERAETRPVAKKHNAFRSYDARETLARALRSTADERGLVH